MTRHCNDGMDYNDGHDRNDGTRRHEQGERKAEARPGGLGSGAYGVLRGGRGGGGAANQSGVLNEALSAHKQTLDEALNAQNRTLNEALSAQNRTLRMIWQQCGGRPDQRLPIDE